MNRNLEQFATATYAIAQSVYSMDDFKKRWLPMLEAKIKTVERETEQEVSEEFRAGGRE